MKTLEERAQDKLAVWEAYLQSCIEVGDWCSARDALVNIESMEERIAALNEPVHAS